jgi:phage N-6-adenine-methyltransferase
MTEALAATRLDELEQTIERGLETFVEVGEALREIRDARLYKEQNETFEDYCRERWGMGRNFANKQIAAAEVVAALGTAVPNGPDKDRQARELTPLREQPEEMAAAWEEATESAAEQDRTVTAADVKEAVGRRVEPGRGFTGYSSATDEWATPQDLFDELNAEFKFTLDVCALPSSAKCKRYFSPEDDGLAQDWKRGVCWMNPPYGEVIGDWMRKALDAAGNGAVVVCLVPARVDTGWWWDTCLYGEIRFIKGRLKFGGGTTGAPFPSAVVVFGDGYSPKVKWWTR